MSGRTMRLPFGTGVAVLLAAACGPVSAGGPCQPTTQPVPFPDALRESSGVAVSLDHPGVFWTHNDASSVLYAVDEAGRVLTTFTLPRAFRDWEDLALSACPGGGSCLYAADVGDNYEEYGHLFVVRLREPDPDSASVGALAVFPIRLPEGPRDIESLLVLPGERVLLVTKGRNHPVTVYRYPGVLRADTVTLEAVQTLSDGPRILPRQVTGGAVSPRGSVLALRTYQSLRFYTLQADTLAEVDGGMVNLRTLNESQGEGVGIGVDGQVVLTSEGGPGGRAATLAVLRCSVDGL